MVISLLYLCAGKLLKSTLTWLWMEFALDRCGGNELKRNHYLNRGPTYALPGKCQVCCRWCHGFWWSLSETVPCALRQFPDPVANLTFAITFLILINIHWFFIDVNICKSCQYSIYQNELNHRASWLGSPLFFGDIFIHSVCIPSMASKTYAFRQLIYHASWTQRHLHICWGS